MNTLNLSLDLFGMILMLLLLFNHLLRKVEITEKEKCFRVMLFIMALILGGHAYFLHGNLAMAKWERIILGSLPDSGFFIVLGIYTQYLLSMTDAPKEKKIRFRKAGYVLSLTGTAIWAVGCVFDVVYEKTQEGYRYTDEGIWIVEMIVIVLFLYDGFLVLYYRKALGRWNSLFFILLPSIPLFTKVVYNVIPGLFLRLPAAALSLLVIYVRFYVDDGKRLTLQNKKLMERREAAILGAISPELIHSVTGETEKLCREDPEKARHYLELFSAYLRDKMDAYNEADQAVFSQELNSVRRYLELLELRFPNRIRIFYEINEQDFLLPRMTIQSFLQNYLEKTLEQQGTRVDIRIGEKRESGGIRIRLRLVLKAGRGHASFLEGNSTTTARIRDRLHSYYKSDFRWEKRRDTILEARITIPEEKGSELWVSTT